MGGRVSVSVSVSISFFVRIHFRKLLNRNEIIYLEWLIVSGSRRTVLQSTFYVHFYIVLYLDEIQFKNSNFIDIGRHGFFVVHFIPDILLLLLRLWIPILASLCSRTFTCTYLNIQNSRSFKCPKFSFFSFFHSFFAMHLCVELERLHYQIQAMALSFKWTKATNIQRWYNTEHKNDNNNDNTDVNTKSIEIKRKLFGLKIHNNEVVRVPVSSFSFSVSHLKFFILNIFCQMNWK